MEEQSKSGQRKIILDMLKTGRISRKAFFYKGIACPTGRITELRSEKYGGHDIKCIELGKVNGQRMTAYELVVKP
jgi:hypothetical protein